VEERPTALKLLPEFAAIMAAILLGSRAGGVGLGRFFF